MKDKLHALEVKVAETIVKLQSSGVKPSHKKVINLIGGSFSTVGPVFNAIKKKFGSFDDTDEICKHYKLARYKPEEIFYKNIELQKQVIELEELNSKLAASNAEFAQEKFQLEADRDKYCNLYHSIVTEREHILNSIKQEKDSQIESLLEEIKATHKSYTKQLQDSSTKYEDKLIQAKVELINFKEKLNRQDSKLIQREQQVVPQQKLINNLQDENKSLVAKIHELEQEVQAAKS